MQRLCFPFLFILHVILRLSVLMQEGFHTVSGETLNSPSGTSKKSDHRSSVEGSIGVRPSLTFAPGAFMVLRSTLLVAACSAMVLRSSSLCAASSTGQAVGSKGSTSCSARRRIMDRSSASSLAKAALRFSNSVCFRALRSDMHHLLEEHLSIEKELTVLRKP